MKSTITAAAVVLLHVAVFAPLIGCRSTTGFEKTESTTNTVIYSGAHVPGAPVTSTAVPVGETEIAPPSPAVATPVAASPQAAPQYEFRPVESSSVSLGFGTPPAGSEVPVSAPVGVGAGKTYTVKRGESLWLIAKREKTTIAALCAANGLSQNATLRAGQKIVIPESSGKTVTSTTGTTTVTASENSAATGEIYVVQKGDILGTIAKKHGTTVAKIREANSLKSDNILIGQKLRIPAGATVKPATAPATAPTSAVGTGTPAATPARPATTPAPATPAPSGDLLDLSFFGVPPSVTATPAASPSPATAVPTTTSSSMESTPVSR